MAVILGRFLVGFAVGTITGVAPVFGAEIAKVSFLYANPSLGRQLTCTRLKRELGSRP